MTGNAQFRLHAPFEPAGDQPQAIDALCAGLEGGGRFQTLEGVTGSGKTFTMANVITRIRLPTIVVSHNKTLAAQLYSEFKEFFPDNAVEYFISYYDYYQPEAYIPQTDTLIEKDASINEQIERMRLSATNSILEREDVIIVASVSCIYGLGSPEDYSEMIVRACAGDEVERDEFLRKLVDIQYDRNDYSFEPGTFRVRGDSVDIFPSYSNACVRVEFLADRVTAIRRLDPVTGKAVADLQRVTVSPARHFVMPADKVRAAIASVMAEMEERVRWFTSQGRLLEAQRLRMRTCYDMEMLREMGYCAGVENYSRHLSGRAPGQPPSTLLDYFRGPFLTILDESHATVPQLRAMFHGDQSRKETLVEYGFRLPSAKDNRPLSFEEFMGKVGQVIFASATPGPYERQVSAPAVEQVVRPTGLVDPPVIVRPLKNQVDDLVEEVRKHAERGERCLVTTLTKKSAEDLTDYLKTLGLRVRYLHSEIDALDRIDVIRGLRKADFDCLVGINLLREGLDLPEVALVAVLDADKEGFLRSETSLLQTAGRAARNLGGKVILYAASKTDSMQRMIEITERRRLKQSEHNERLGITPRTITKKIGEALDFRQAADEMGRAVVREDGVDYDVNEALNELKREMLEAARNLEFERAAALRDEIMELSDAAPGLVGLEDVPGRESGRRSGPAGRVGRQSKARAGAAGVKKMGIHRIRRVSRGPGKAS